MNRPLPLFTNFALCLQLLVTSCTTNRRPAPPVADLPSFSSDGTIAAGRFPRHEELLKTVEEVIHNDGGEHLFVNIAETGAGTLRFASGRFGHIPNCWYILNLCMEPRERSCAVVTVVIAPGAAGGTEHCTCKIHICYWDGANWWCEFSFGPF